MKSEKVEKTTKTDVTETKKSTDYVGILKDSLNTLKNYLLKPTESIKDEKTEEVKSVVINGGIISVLMTLVNLLMTMLSSLKSTSIDWTGKVTYSIKFSNLSKLNYLSLIFKNLFIYIIIMLVIAGIFYIGSLIVKKEIKYTKLLSIVFISVIPFVIGNIVLANILGLIYSSLSLIVIIISTTYSIALFTYLVNNEIKIKDMTRIYYNAICFSVIMLSIYFILEKILLSTISNISSLF
jgi:hypothetical protein